VTANGPSRIICVGSRFFAADAAGPRVHDRLSAQALPQGVELVDGGVAGLNLLHLVETAERVVFVDAVRGFAADGRVVVLDADEAAEAGGDVFDHGAGLGYLLRMLPVACDAPPPVTVVGIEGPADDEAVREAAAVAVRVATAGGRHPKPPPRPSPAKSAGEGDGAGGASSARSLPRALSGEGWGGGRAPHETTSHRLDHTEPHA